ELFVLGQQRKHLPQVFLAANRLLDSCIELGCPPKSRGVLGPKIHRSRKAILRFRDSPGFEERVTQSNPSIRLSNTSAQRFLQVRHSHNLVLLVPVSKTVGRIQQQLIGAEKASADSVFQRRLETIPEVGQILDIRNQAKNSAQKNRNFV